MLYQGDAKHFMNVISFNIQKNLFYIIFILLLFWFVFADKKLRLRDVNFIT